MRGISQVPEYVVMQPTTLCNLNCSYCYLPDRTVNRRMSVEVARAVAKSVNTWAADNAYFSVVWHGGEPLATGRGHFAALMEPFHNVEHQVQTNATLIEDKWCALFAECGVRVSISVDGPPARNTNRVNHGATVRVYDWIMRGADALRRHGLGFSALCVVSDPVPGLATELYDYFLDLGCDALGVNIEEQEGVNENSNARDDGAVQAFWAELVAAWRQRPRIRVRELEWTLRYAEAVLDGTADAVLPRGLDPIPSIATDGRVYLFSPELAGFTDARYGDFSSGNVLTEPLDAILARAAESAVWVPEYLAGVEACRATCPYFGMCGGANASNRYFEHGRFDVPQTNHCRNSKIRLLEGVLDHVWSD